MRHFFIKGETHIFTSWGGGEQTRGGQTFYVGGSGWYDDVMRDMYVSEANILVSEARKISAEGPAVLVVLKYQSPKIFAKRH